LLGVEMLSTAVATPAANPGFITYSVFCEDLVKTRVFSDHFANLQRGFMSALVPTVGKFF